MENIIYQLHAEYIQFYKNIINKYGGIPKSFSGVSSENEQFIFVLDNLSLSLLGKGDFIKVVLREEQSICYGHGSLSLTEDSIEELSISSATNTEFLRTNFLVKRNEDGEISLEKSGEWKGDNPSEYPTTWHLNSKSVISKQNEDEYLELWDTIKNSAIWRKM